MKILIPLTIVDRIDNNPFVSVISEGLGLYGHEVICSREAFWNQPFLFDMIFFQWPEGVITEGDESSQALNSLKEHLKCIKKRGIPMVITVHNLHPHNNNQYINKVYDCIYDSVDAFHHMGQYSLDYMKSKYPQKTHFIVPHPIYYDNIELKLSQEECKKKYNLPINKPTILAFGAFRNDDERNMFLDLSHKFRFKACFWAPKFNRTLGIERNIISKIATRLKYQSYGIKMNFGLIGNTEVLEIITASDILFIQRLEILNSGNLSLGFSGSNIVVGPDKGNVGEILRVTGNPVFDPQDKSSVRNAIEIAINMYKQGSNLGQRNFNYALKNWSKARVAQMLNNELSRL